MSYSLKRGDASVEEGVKRIAVSQIDKAIGETDDEALGPHDTVHQVRKRCKKLRGLIRLVRPALSEYKHENQIFRDAAAPLSHIRDAEAMIETYDALVRVYDDTVDRRAFGSIRRRLTGRKKEVAEDKDAEEKLAAFRDTMVEARDRAQGWSLDGDGFDVIAAGVKKTYRRGQKALAHAREQPTAENLHELRKRVKYHRYHADILRSIWPRGMTAHEEAGDELGEFLGDHHNLAVFKTVLLKDNERFGKAKDVAAFIGLIDQRQTDLAAEAFALGPRVFAEKASDLTRRWQAYWNTWQDEKSLRKEILAA